MANFLRALSNLAVLGVTFLSVIAIFYKTLTPLQGLSLLAFFLLIGFVSLIIYQMTRLENKVDKIEERYIRDNELIDIKADIKSLKMNKKGKLKINSEDVLEIIKIAIALIIGYIIIRALLSAM